MGLEIYKPARKPYLSKKNKDRLNFFMKHKDWSPQHWENVMFSDKTSVRVFKFHEACKKTSWYALLLKIHSYRCEECIQSYGMGSNIN